MLSVYHIKPKAGLQSEENPLWILSIEFKTGGARV